LAFFSSPLTALLVAATAGALTLVPGSADAGQSLRPGDRILQEREASKERVTATTLRTVRISPASTTQGVTDEVAVEVPADLTEETADPLEPVNRVVFHVNEAIDFVVVRPVATVYRAVVPKPLRRGVANALRNASSPIILANDILQGADGKRVEATLVRFMLNSTIGVGGLIDVGSKVGLEGHSEDFGQTLAVWGVGPGPYLVAPILGPTNPRDLTGKVVDTAFNPLTWLLVDEDLIVRAAPSVAEVISNREAVLEEVDDLRKNSPDFYVTVRQLYGEKRQSEIANGEVGIEPIPDTTSLPSSEITPSVEPF
jgi:phospholipid-binding lipoprotein MlaA